MKNRRGRLIWVDITKGIAIFTVILFHTGFLPLQHQLLPLLTPWMLPIFAVLSGMLLEREREINFANIFVRRFRRLIIPFIGFGTISYISWLLLRWYAPTSVLFVPWKQALLLFLAGTGSAFNGPLWFLPAYFIASISVVFLRKLIMQCSVFILFILSLALTWLSILLNPSRTIVVYSYDLSVLFIGFMLMGFAFTRFRIETIKSYTWLLIVCLYIFTTSMNGTVDIFERSYSQWWLFWLTGLLGSLIVIRGSQNIANAQNRFSFFLSRLGSDALLLLVTHWPIMQWVTFGFFITGLLHTLGATPTYTTFFYYHSNKYIFTLIELPLLIFYTTLPFLVLPIVSIIRRKLQHI